MKLVKIVNNNDIDEMYLEENLRFEYISSHQCQIRDCINHAVIICEFCGRFTCALHKRIYWSQNFIQHAFLAQKTQYISMDLCVQCESKKRKNGVVLAIFLLIPFLITPLAILFG